MATVREFLTRNTLRLAEERLAKLKELGDPTILVKLQEKYVDSLKAGVFKVGGDKDALDDEYAMHTALKGRGGKWYLAINDGRINYFPNATYGPFIKRNPPTEA